MIVAYISYNKYLPRNFVRKRLQTRKNTILLYFYIICI